ncbi:MFS transporter [Chloroflexota bacterium]
MLRIKAAHKVCYNGSDLKTEATRDSFIVMNQETNQPIKTGPQSSYGYVVVVAAFFAVFMLTFHNTYGIFFKPMIAEFGWTRALTSGAFALSNFMRGLAGILMGGISDRVGARTVLTLCGFLMGLGYLLMSQINNAGQLYILYAVLIGLGGSGVWIPTMSTVAKWFTKRRSLMTGIVITGLNIGTIVMPPLVNWLISIYDWRITYVIMGGAVLVIFVSAAQFLRRAPTQMRPSHHGGSEGAEGKLKSGTEGFSLREAVCTNQFWLATGMGFCAGFWRISIIIHIVPHATDLGISAANSANILAAIGGVSILGSVIGGAVSDRFGGRQAYIISFILMSAASFWLLQAKATGMLYVFAIIFGLGSGSCSPLMSPLIAKIFGLRSHGMIFGAANFTYTIGAALGPFLTGYIFDVSGSYQLAFLITAFMGIVGLILAATLRPVHKLDVQ